MNQQPEPVFLEDMALVPMEGIPGGVNIYCKGMEPSQGLQKIETMFDTYFGQDKWFAVHPSPKFEFKGKIPSVLMEDNGNGRPTESNPVNIVYYGRDEKSIPRDRKADYAVAWDTVVLRERFGVYFNIGNESEAKRDAFLEAAKSMRLQ